MPLEPLPVLSCGWKDSPRPWMEPGPEGSEIAWGATPFLSIAGRRAERRINVDETVMAVTLRRKVASIQWSFRSLRLRGGGAAFELFVERGVCGVLARVLEVLPDP